MSTTNRTARVTPRMGQGGAEQGILQLLETIDDTHLIVTGPGGPLRGPREGARSTLHLHA